MEMLCISKCCWTPLPNTAFMGVAADQPWWEDLRNGNWQRSESRLCPRQRAGQWTSTWTMETNLYTEGKRWGSGSVRKWDSRCGVKAASSPIPGQLLPRDPAAPFLGSRKTALRAHRESFVRLKLAQVGFCIPILTNEQDIKSTRTLHSLLGSF